LKRYASLRLKKQIGLKHIDYVKICPYTGKMRWTWEIYEIGPKEQGADKDTALALTGASEEVAKLHSILRSEAKSDRDCVTPQPLNSLYSSLS
jgi:hypothetical protein